MPGTYSQLLLHAVFSTRDRKPWISDEVAERLYPYIGGVADHVHLYLRWRTDGAVADLMRAVKSRSSKWIHDIFPDRAEFGWQEGYAAFSVSKSQGLAVKSYIARQAEHHRKEDFKSEFLRFLRAHEVEFNERYVFD